MLAGRSGWVVTVHNVLIKVMLVCHLKLEVRSYGRDTMLRAGLPVQHRQPGPTRNGLGLQAAATPDA